MNRSIHTVAGTLALIVLMTTAVEAGSARLRVSDTAHLGSTQSDIDAEVQFGRTLAARILGRYPLHEDKLLQEYVALIGHHLAASCGRPELNFAFGVIKSEEINAFAAPGGYIFITSGALSQMKDEAELAGVLGHEIGHINARHMVKAFDIRGTDASAGAGLASLIGGTTASLRGALQQSLARATDILFHSGYQAKEELDADQTGLYLAVLSGYDAGGLGRFLTRVGGFEAGASRSSTHPLHGARLKALGEGQKTLIAASDQARSRRYTSRFEVHLRRSL